MIDFYYEGGGWSVLCIEWRGWNLHFCTREWLPDSITLMHPDTRVFGFWFEDFEFDRYSAMTAEDIEEDERMCREGWEEHEKMLLLQAEKE